MESAYWEPSLIKREIDGKEVTIELTPDETYNIFRQERICLYCMDVEGYLTENNKNYLLEHQDTVNMVKCIASEFERITLKYDDIDRDEALKSAVEKVEERIDLLTIENDASR